MTERTALLDNAYTFVVSGFFTSAVIATVFAGLF